MPQTAVSPIFRALQLLTLLALLKSPEIGRNSCLRHAIGNYLELK